YDRIDSQWVVIHFGFGNEYVIRRKRKQCFCIVIKDSVVDGNEIDVCTAGDSWHVIPQDVHDFFGFSLCNGIAVLSRHLMENTVIRYVNACIWTLFLVNGEQVIAGVCVFASAGDAYDGIKGFQDICNLSRNQTVWNSPFCAVWT